MKTVLLCGGMGTRLAEETTTRPKPMIPIGHRPVLWHIMHLYAARGFKEFVCALGYKGEQIKEYFLNYPALNNDFSIDLATGHVEPYGKHPLDWKVHLIETGEKTQTGGRLLRLKHFLRNEKTFMLTYGDGVADVDVSKVLEFHKSHGKIATVTAVRPTARFGGLRLEKNEVVSFQEKPQSGEGWINGGFFVFENAIFEYLLNDQSILEREPMEELVADRQLMTYRHEGFWQCMDTLREKQLLEQLWLGGTAPWRIWPEAHA